MKPTVYFAGKIGPNDWRHELFPWLRGYCNDHKGLLNQRLARDCGNFIYGGPFFIGCDHRCAHGPSQHGAAAEGAGGCISGAHIPDLRRQIFDINKRRLERANFLFGYVESIDAYGTILEIGMASTLQIPIALRLPADPDLWMTFHAATKLYDGTAAECWQKFQHDFISQFYTPVVR
jgi:hypothetical protein